MARTDRSAKRTVNHDEIRRWVEAHGGYPGAVKQTGRGGDPGILRIDFPGFSGESMLEALDWDTFFDWFERNELAFIYQDMEESRFNKLVRRRPEERGSRDSAKEASASPKEGRGPDAVRLLEHQHREVESLLEEFESSDDKQGLFERVADALAAHSEIEERIFYPSVLAGETEELLRESVEEHLAIKRIIADMVKMKAGDPQFDAKFDLMRELFGHHVHEEEHRLFMMLQRLDAARLSSLGERMQSAFDDIIRHEPRKQVSKEMGAAAPLPG
jgi:hypothetical protein